MIIRGTMVNLKSNYTIAAESLDSILKMLAIAKTAVMQQYRLIKIAKPLEVKRLAGRIDKIAQNAMLAGLPLLTGRYAKSNDGSIWVNLGPNANGGERIFLPNMMSRALGLHSIKSKAGLRKLNERFDIVIATLDAYTRRIRIAQELNYDLGRFQPRFRKPVHDPMVNQIQLLDSVLVITGYYEKILNRIRRLRRQAETIKTTGKLAATIELSQLIDEVDRIASTADFNSKKLLLGDYAEASKLTSMWFHAISGPKVRRYRVIIPTMTSRALKILTNHTRDIKLEGLGNLEFADNQVTRLRTSMKNLKTDLEKNHTKLP